MDAYYICNSLIQLMMHMLIVRASTVQVSVYIYVSMLANINMQYVSKYKITNDLLLLSSIWPISQEFFSESPHKNSGRSWDALPSECPQAQSWCPFFYRQCHSTYVKPKQNENNNNHETSAELPLRLTELYISQERGWGSKVWSSWGGRNHW